MALGIILRFDALFEDILIFLKTNIKGNRINFALYMIVKYEKKLCVSLFNNTICCIFKNS